MQLQQAKIADIDIESFNYYAVSILKIVAYQMLALGGYKFSQKTIADIISAMCCQ